MPKSAFDDNVPRVRPRLRLGKALAEVETLTEPPPSRPREEPAAESPSEEATARDSEPLTFEAEGPPSLSPESEHGAHMAVPAVGEAEALPDEPILADAETPAEPVVEELQAAPVSVEEVVEDATRRASLKRRAASLGALPEEPPAPVPSAILDELDAVEATAALAEELQRALTAAAEANDQLRGDLSSALDDLARSTAESKRLHERIERLDAEARERSKVVQDLVREMELLEAERDSALMQTSDAQLELEAHGDKMLLLERRVHELERGLSEAQARTRRFEESAQAHVAQRAALRAELDALRRERDNLLARNAELEKEREDLGRSRRALDEVHRALSEAKSRVQRIRPR